MKCLLCGKNNIPKINFSSLFLIKEKSLCNECLKMLDKVEGGCIYCGKKTSERICDDCLYWQKKIQIPVINYSLYYYNNYAKDFMKKFKFLGDVALINVFSNDIKEFFKKFKNKNYYLVPIPLHEERLLQRGFNQSLILAQMINFPILNILRKNNNEKQSKKKKIDRILLDNQYSLLDNNIDLQKKKIIIIDDIYTTGATIHKVARVLMRKKVSNILSFTLFRG